MQGEGASGLSRLVVRRPTSLGSSQIATYCDQLNVSASETIQKLFLMESFHKAGL